MLVRTNESEAAAAARIGAGLAVRKRAELMAALRSCFPRTQTWQQAGKYVSALVSDLPKRNGWTAAEHAGDRGPDRMQRLLNRASWDAPAAMSEVRRFAWAGLEKAAQRGRRRGGLVIAAIDETGQVQKTRRGDRRGETPVHGLRTPAANGINTVHVSLVREKAGHALIGARQWIAREHIADPVTSLVMGLPLDLEFRTKGQLAMDICADCRADGLSFDFACGDEVLRQLHEAAGVLRGARAGLRAAGRLELHDHPRSWHQDDLRGCGEQAAEGPAALGGPVRRQGVAGRTLVRLGLDRRRIAAAPSAGPPSPEDR